MSTKITGVQLVNSTVDNTPIGEGGASNGVFTNIRINRNVSDTRFWIDDNGNALRISSGGSPGSGPMTVDINGNVVAAGTFTMGSIPSETDNSAKSASTSWCRLGLAVSLGQSGYIKLPSWLGSVTLEWGITSQFDTGPVYIPFPRAFSVACYSIQLTNYFGFGNTASRIWNIRSFTASGFEAQNNGTGAALWFAVGV